VFAPFDFTPAVFEKMKPEDRANYLASLDADHPIWSICTVFGMSREQVIGRLLLIALSHDPSN